jgi:hypothetical protein
VRRNVLLLLAVSALALAAAEAALRSGPRPLWVIPYPPVCLRSDLFQRWDAYGYRLWPSRLTQLRWPPTSGRTVRITANAEGFRMRHDLRAPAGRPRIVVVGDSMIFGLGVEEPERVTELLEAAEPGWRVDNMGMVGFGPDLMLMSFEAVGLDPPPAVVVVALFTHDLYRVAPEVDGVGFPVPRFVLRDRSLARVPYPERPPWTRLYVVQGARYLYWRYTVAAYPLDAAILERFAALARSRGFRLAIAFVPGPRERWDDRRRAAWVAAWAAAHGTPFLDLRAPIAAAGGERMYLPADAHWNPEGHRVAAAELQRFLRPLVAEKGG